MLIQNTVYNRRCKGMFIVYCTTNATILALLIY